jgi:hypothetical protein
MHDDPTRMMGRPEGRDPGGNGNTRLLVAGLIAVIVGLVIAIVVIAGGDGGDDGGSAPAETTLPAPAGDEATDETDSSAGEEGAVPDGEDEEAEGPEAEEGEAEPEEGEAEEPEDGSGGIEAP